MRILQICNKAPYPPNDGSSIAIFNMGMGFILNGVELHVLAINTKKHFKSDALVPEEYKKNAQYRSVYKNTNVNILGSIFNLFSSHSYFVSRFYFKEYQLALIETLQKNKFDIIQIEGVFMGVYIPLIKKYSDAKIVLRAHNVEYLIWERHLKNENSFFKKTYLSLQVKRLKKFELLTLNRVYAIVSITDFDKSVFNSIQSNKPVFTCMTGVDIAKYKKTTEGLVQKSKTIFHFASMDWMPNQEAVDWFLQNCWPEVLKAVPESKFVIAGRNMPSRFLNLNQPNVLVIENVPDSKRFYETHEIMLVPLLSGSGLRIKIIEGMAYGKAIVSTAIGAEGINIENEKNIIIKNTHSDFSYAVIDLLTNPDKRKKIENEALRFAENEFDNKKVVLQLINFYKTLLNV